MELLCFDSPVETEVVKFYTTTKVFVFTPAGNQNGEHPHVYISFSTLMVSGFLLMVLKPEALSARKLFLPGGLLEGRISVCNIL